MKNIVFLLMLLLGLLTSMNSKSQTYYYKYLYSVNDDGMKMEHKHIKSHFNVGKDSYFTFYKNKSILCFTKKDGISNDAYFRYNRTNDNGIHIYNGFYTAGVTGYANALFIRNVWQIGDADIKICFSSDYSRVNIVATNYDGRIMTFVLERQEYRDDEKAPDTFY